MNRDLETAILVAIADYEKTHHEIPKNAPEDDLVTRSNMRTRVKRAVRWGFKRGVEWQKGEEK